ncbi:hypothetical protein CROQUDRAFT_662975 [Cronartium quercuum f. sp. fusiforme G11]|uniref:Uncharacterized protein n=1 Tax=Cronartium quercuum f. sp. fusiforme G11 TaxID=708437 RepID=A0A9P6T7I9_9BASI|nr:hypothetical protein CROQUDRAFT_662975 [Cronartium quercuum f. sp. fusiforme G11]
MIKNHQNRNLSSISTSNRRRSLFIPELSRIVNKSREESNSDLRRFSEQLRPRLLIKPSRPFSWAGKVRVNENGLKNKLKIRSESSSRR